MAEIVDYKDMTVETLRTTEDPAIVVAVALAIVMKQDTEADIIPVSEETCKKLWLAEHASVFEHVNYTFLIEGVSRSFLAQITRQRTASPTSGSQHYQDYSDYPMAIDTKHKDDMWHALDTSLDAYKDMVDTGVPREEARQILPNASTVNYLWTIDALNLFKFLRQRCCNRNVKEMRIFANKVLKIAQADFPALFNHAGPQCYEGECQQGLFNMQCKAGTWVKI